MKHIIMLFVCFSIALGETASPPPRWEMAFQGRQDFFPVLVFTSSKRLAISDIDQLATGVNSDILLLDAGTGTLLSRIPSSAPTFLSGFERAPIVVPLRDGRFLVKSWNLLRLLSADGQELKRRTLTLESVQASYNTKLLLWDRWDIAASPDGTAALATRHRSSHREAEEHWLSTDTLDDIEVESADSGRCCLAVSRKHVVYSSSAPKLEPLWIRAKGAAARLLCAKCFGDNGVFLNDDHVVFATWPKASLAIASTGGAIKFRRSFGEADDTILAISVAATPQRVAFLSGPGHVPATVANYKIGIFDVDQKRLVLKMSLAIPTHRTERLTTIISPQIAVSPDGKSLAVLTNSALQLYSLEQ